MTSVLHAPAPSAPSAAQPPAVPAVSLVGAGPGDPELLTLRALRRIETADVVLYDLLVSQAILDLIPPRAERICVGKRASRHTLPQEDTNRLIVQKAQDGLRVVRLKGGDPFMFGRGGEEMQELARAGIACEVVPGITAAMGAAACTGIPLTHRDHTQMVSFVTGHRKQDSSTLDWVEHLDPASTLVVYMGLGESPRIVQDLMAHGFSGDTPLAVVASATLPQQQVGLATLATLEAMLAKSTLTSPALLIIGSVVTLHTTLYPLIRQARAQLDLPTT